MSLPWLTYNSSEASSLLEATDIQSRCHALALNPQTLHVTATLELKAPQAGSCWVGSAATLLTHSQECLMLCLGLSASSTSQTVFLHLCRFVFSSAAVDAASASSPAAHSSQLTLVASRFTVNGTWLGFANVTSSQLQLCSGPQAGAGAWLAFGQNYRSVPACQQSPCQQLQLLCLPLLSKMEARHTRRNLLPSAHWCMPDTLLLFPLVASTAYICML